MAALIIILFAFGALGWLAVRYGHDSTQPRPVSEEEHYARFGMTWENLDPSTALDRPRQRPVEMRATGEIIPITRVRVRAGSADRSPAA